MEIFVYESLWENVIISVSELELLKGMEFLRN